MGTSQLNKKEQDLLVLCLVKECIKFSKINKKSFEKVLNEDVFANKASIDYAEMVCKSIDTLKKEGYITGTVEIEYEFDTDGETFEEETTDDIDLSMCTFDNIGISVKGELWLGIDGFKEVSKDFIEKSKPFIKCVATKAIETAVEIAVTTGMKAVGFPV